MFEQLTNTPHFEQRKAIRARILAVKDAKSSIISASFNFVLPSHYITLILPIRRGTRGANKTTREPQRVRNTGEKKEKRRGTYVRFEATRRNEQIKRP